MDVVNDNVLLGPRIICIDKTNVIGKQTWLVVLASFMVILNLNRGLRYIHMYDPLEIEPASCTLKVIDPSSASPAILVSFI